MLPLPGKSSSIDLSGAVAIGMHDSTELQISIGPQRYRADLSGRCDLGITLNFNGPQPNCFAAPAAQATPLRVQAFTGSVDAGASCNCSTYTLTPHCNGTHTECIGHITREPVSIGAIAVPDFAAARLISVQPLGARSTDEPIPESAGLDDLLITRSLLEQAATPAALAGCSALIVRTLPNSSTKLERHYSISRQTPYFTVQAIQWMVDAGLTHLVVDLPSLDRLQDGGKLLAHRTFWGMPAGAVDALSASRPEATITEMAFIPDEIADGVYLLSLQIAPFAGDAAPSRPVIFPLRAL